MKSELLGWMRYPEPNGTGYFEEDLMDKSKVVELFDYYQILLATIMSKGWKFLFENYGLIGILEIDKESGCFDDGDLGEWIANIYYNSLISGFDPLKMEYGDYSEDGIFTNEEGEQREIDWNVIYDLKNDVSLQKLIKEE